MKRFLATLALAGAVVSAPLTALAAPQTMPDGSQFDAEYYAATNPDVVAVYGTDANALYQHYVTCGKNEGRAPFSLDEFVMILEDGTVFDPVYYAASNPDVASVLGTNPDLLLQHYEACGKAEGRKPSDLTNAAGPEKEVTTPADPATLPYYATFRGLIVTADNPAYSELANAAIGLLSAPEATMSVVRYEAPGYELLSSDNSIWVQTAVVEQDTTPVEKYVPGDMSIFTFHVRADYQGQHFDRYIAYGPELQRYERAEEAATAYLVTKLPEFAGHVQYAGYKNENLVQVYADHLGIQIILTENDISDLRDNDNVVVHVNRMASEAEKAGKPITPWIVGTVTKVQ